MKRIQLFEWPAALLRRLVFTIAAGGLFLLVGLVASIPLRDLTLAVLSVLLALMTFLRGFFLYQLVSRGAYETAEGVCIEIRRLPMRKQQSVRLLAADGEEHIICLDRRTQLRTGNCYRLYFRADPDSAAVPQELQTRNLFLGLENLGAYCPEEPDTEHFSKSD